MAITRERETSKQVVLDDTTEKLKETKEKSKKKDKTESTAKKERFLSIQGLKEEYSKIIWPTPTRIFKETAWIVIFLIIVSAGIAIADLGIYYFITGTTAVNATQESIIKACLGMGAAIAVIALIFFLLRERSGKKQ